MYKGDNLDTIHYNYYQVENKCELTGNGQMQLLDQTIIRSLKSVIGKCLYYNVKKALSFRFKMILALYKSHIHLGKTLAKICFYL